MDSKPLTTTILEIYQHYYGYWEVKVIQEIPIIACGKTLDEAVVTALKSAYPQLLDKKEE